MTLRLTIVLLAACVAAAPMAARAASALAGPVEAEVVRVIDGDTIVVRAVVWIDQVITVSVRVAGVEAPDIFRPDCAEERAAGAAAKAFVEAFLSAGRVRLTDIRNDKYGGRVNARLANEDGEDLGRALLAAGHAQPYGAAVWCEPSR
jgi:endonuclease YncB( thermonuclease family)